MALAEIVKTELIPKYKGGHRKYLEASVTDPSVQGRLLTVRLIGDNCPLRYEYVFMPFDLPQVQEFYEFLIKGITAKFHGELIEAGSIRDFDLKQLLPAVLVGDLKVGPINYPVVIHSYPSPDAFTLFRENRVVSIDRKF